MDEQTKNRKQTTAFTLLELLVVLLVIALLLSWLMSGYHKGCVKPEAIRLVCRSNLHQLYTTLLAYLQKIDKPLSQNWCDQIKSRDVKPAVFRCPEDRENWCNYTLNENTIGLKVDQIPENIVLFFESKPGWNQVGGAELLAPENHEGDGCNILFGDGHVEFVKTEDLSKLKWKAD